MFAFSLLHGVVCSAVTSFVIIVRSQASAAQTETASLYDDILGTSYSQLDREVRRKDLGGLMRILLKLAPQRKYSAIRPPHRQHSMVSAERGQVLLDRRLLGKAAIASVLHGQATPAFARDAPVTIEQVRENLIKGQEAKYKQKQLENKLLSGLSCVALINDRGQPFWNKEDFNEPKTGFFFLDPEDAAEEYRRLKRLKYRVRVKVLPVKQIYRKFVQGDEKKLQGKFKLKPRYEDIQAANLFGAGKQYQNIFTTLAYLFTLGGTPDGLTADKGEVPIFFSSQVMTAFDPIDNTTKYPFFLGYDDFRGVMEKNGVDLNAGMAGNVTITSVDMMISGLADNPALQEAIVIPDSKFQSRVEEAFRDEIAKGDVRRDDIMVTDKAKAFS